MESFGLSMDDMLDGSNGNASALLKKQNEAKLVQAVERESRAIAERAPRKQAERKPGKYAVRTYKLSPDVLREMFPSRPMDIYSR